MECSEFFIYVTCFLSAVAISISITFAIVVNNNLDWFIDTKADVRELQLDLQYLEKRIDEFEQSFEEEE